MITKVYNLNGDLISDLVNSAILNPETTYIQNELLDGSYHIQIIGQPRKIWDVIVYVDEKNKNILDSLYLRGEPVKLYKQGVVHLGLMRDKSEWSVYIPGKLYEVNFKFHEQEGE